MKFWENYATEVNAIKKDIKKKKKDNKNKEKENKNLKDENERITKMVDGIKTECEKKTQEKDVEIEKLQIIEADAEAYVAIVTKDEQDKEIKRDKYKNSVKILTINHNQVWKK